MKMLREKRFRYGTFSTAMMLFAVVLFVLVNLIAGEFNRNFDLTRQQIFTLTRQSEDFLAHLDQDVTITHIAPTGNEHYVISQLLIEYAAASNHITIETRDPMFSPALIHQFALEAGIEGGIADNSVVIRGADGTIVLQPMEMMSFNVDMFGRPESIRSYNFESEITRAIHRLTLGEPPIVYYVIGSGEMPLPQGLSLILESGNFVIREIDLVMQEVPEDADILILAMPVRDWTEVKAGRIAAFLEDEGRAFIALNYFPVEMPNMDGVLAAYGIGRGEHIILEGDARNIFQYTNWIFPNTTSHDITDGVQGPHLLMDAAAVETLPVRRVSTNIEPLWRTSHSAFARVDTEDVTGSQIPGDIPGPFDLAVAITDTQFVERTYFTRLVVVGSNAALSDEVNSVIGGGNARFVLSALHWLHGQPPGIFVPPRIPPGRIPIMINQVQRNVMTGVALGGLPLVCIAFGVFVWFRRRYN